jgi:putative DNA primase/helicase
VRALHDPADLITRLANVVYDPNATCPRYDAFVAEVQPSAAVRRFLHQWGGLSLTGNVSEQVLAFFWGKGKNGKSTLLGAWGKIAGDYARGVTIETFINEGRGRNAGQATPDLARLDGVRMVHATEPERGATV